MQAQQAQPVVTMTFVTTDPDRELTIPQLEVVTGVGKQTWRRRIAASVIWRNAFYPALPKSIEVLKKDRKTVLVTTLSRIREAQEELARQYHGH